MIEELTTKEKTVMLATLMEWKVVNLPLRDGNWKRVIADKDGNDLGFRPVGGGIRPVDTELKPGWIPDLYDPANMAEAWRVLNWAFRDINNLIVEAFHEEGSRWYWHEFFQMPPEKAQAELLDMVLRLAIETEMVKP